MNNNSKGFVHLFLIIAIFIIASGGVGYSIYKNSKNKNIENQPANPTSSVENIDLKDEITGINNSISPTPKVTTPIKPTTIPTVNQNSNSGTSCSYNLTSSTGSVKVNIQAQSGGVVGDQVVELQAQSGCKVLVNKSTDKDTRIAKQGTPTVDFSQAPPGSYSVRVQYKGQWTSYQNISVNSGQQSVTTFTVSGDTPTTTPQPTSKPKPTCSTPGVYPSSSGPAPLSIQLSGYGQSGAAGTMVAYEWDFTADGSWDATGSLNPQSYTYQSAGSFTVKVRVLASNGEYSDTCQTTITVD